MKTYSCGLNWFGPFTTPQQVKVGAKAVAGGTLFTMPNAAESLKENMAVERK